MDDFKNLFDDGHLEKSGKSYWDHFKFAMYGAGLLFYAGITSVIHGIFPRLFPFTSAKITLKLAEYVKSSHSYKHL